MGIKNAINNLKIDLTSIQDENVRGNFILLMNAVEQLFKENESLLKKTQEQADD